MAVGAPSSPSDGVVATVPPGAVGEGALSRITPPPPSSSVATSSVVGGVVGEGIVDEAPLLPSAGVEPSHTSAGTTRGVVSGMVDAACSPVGGEAGSSLGGVGAAYSPVGGEAGRAAIPTTTWGKVGGVEPPKPSRVKSVEPSLSKMSLSSTFTEEEDKNTEEGRILLGDVTRLL